MSDERVERAMDAMWEASGIESWRSDGTATITEHDLEPMARAAVAALDEEPTLEDVLRNKGIVAIALDVGRGSDEYRAIAYRHPERWEGTGFTVDAAIRAAVANAKEQG